MVSSKADLEHLTGRFKVRGDDQSSSSKVIKRPRKAFTCQQCRRAKLRCDRKHPCTSCVRRDQPNTCTYREDDDHGGPSGASVAENRLAHLELLVKELMQNPARTNAHGAQSLGIKTPPATLHELSLGRDESGPGAGDGDGDGEYVGATHWSAVLDDIHELKLAINAARLTPHDGPESQLDHPIRHGELIFGSCDSYSLHDVLSEYLPAKDELDRFVSIYFRSETYIAPFIHSSHFQQQYDVFWSDPAQVNPLWLSILFSICYLASVTGEIGTYQSDSSQTVLSSADLHEASAKCLTLGHYSRPQQYTVEALGLYGLCKNMQSLDPSREAGTIFGMAIRLALEMGYHRDPDSLASLSVFEGEMRRRCWAAVKQIDFMISFQLGLPSNICQENCDTDSPRNLLDSDFGPTTKILPPSRPETDPTPLLWFIVKDRQSLAFAKVCQDALSFRDKTEDEIWMLDREISDMHATIPAILRQRPLTDSIMDSPFQILTRLYLEFLHLKSLCILHRKYMVKGHVFSTQRCVEAGWKIVSQFNDMYQGFAPGGQLYGETWLLTNFTMNDYLLGIMVLCICVHIHHKKGTQFASLISVPLNAILDVLDRSLAVCIEKSHASKDAHRVAQAIRHTLSIAERPDARPQEAMAGPLHISQELRPQDLYLSHTTSLDSTLLPTPLIDYTAGDYTSLALWDPFNFIVNDIEDIDWSSRDTGLLPQNSSTSSLKK